MKNYILPVLVLILFIGCSGINSRDKKIKQTLTAYASRGLDGTTQKIDSVSLIKVDSLTGKQELKYFLDLAKERYATYSEQYNDNIKSAHDAAELIQMYVRKGQAPGKELLKLYILDSTFAAEYTQKMERKKRSIDSLSALLAADNNNSFKSFKVRSRIYYSANGNKGKSDIEGLVSKDFTVDDTSNVIQPTIEYRGNH